jgi:Zn-dependent M28 family amino/carboxypeptidase
LKEWGLSNVALEKWSTSDLTTGAIPGWQATSYSGAMVEPSWMPIIGVPVAWTSGTNGPLTAEAMLAPITTVADFEKFRGKLKGKILLTSAIPDLALPVTPLATRYTGEQLSDMATELIPVPARPGATPATPAMTPAERREFQTNLRKFLTDEGGLMTLQASATGQAGLVFGGGAPRTGDVTHNLPQVSITAENYTRIARLLQHSVPVKLSFDIKTEFTPDTESFNVVAEIPGTTKPQEVVMVGGHFDSWHYGTGATDNAAGSAVAMEVMRILKSLDLKMDRTVRLALWGGEEEGIYGSAAYVKSHFADPAVMKPTAEHANFSSYFNIDNGSGRIRGIYLQGNEMMRPVFEQWFGALKDLTPGIITIRNTTGTDHLSFDAVGLPAFQFVQDPLDYDTRTHHSNMDVYDHVQAADLEQMAIIEAVFVYNAAMRPDKLPRKDLPVPTPPEGGRGGAAPQASAGN